MMLETTMIWGLWFSSINVVELTIIVITLKKEQRSMVWEIAFFIQSCIVAAISTFEPACEISSRNMRVLLENFTSRGKVVATKESTQSSGVWKKHGALSETGVFHTNWILVNLCSINGSIYLTIAKPLIMKHFVIELKINKNREGQSPCGNLKPI